MQISRQTVAEWLDGRQSAEFCRDHHGFFCHTLTVDSVSRKIDMVTSYCEQSEIPPKVSIANVQPTMKIFDLVHLFCRQRGEKARPTGMFVWKEGLWIR